MGWIMCRAQGLCCICTQRTFRCAPRRERSIFTRRGVIQQWCSWLGTLILPLGVVWLNGTADFPLLGFLTLGLVSRALKGWTLGHMTPHLVCLLWWAMVHLWDVDLPSQLPQTPSWPFSRLALSLLRGRYLPCQALLQPWGGHWGILQHFWG